MNGKDPRAKKPTQDALDERYEELLDDRMRAKMTRDERAYNARSAAINRGKYADTSAFESRGHRRIPPEVMRARKRARMIRRAIPVVGVLLIAVIALSVYWSAIRPAGLYKKALASLDAENYNAARDTFSALGTYKDSEKYLVYIDAIFAGDRGEWEQSAQGFASLGNFLDSAQRAASARARIDTTGGKADAYQRAIDAYERGDYAGAKTAFAALGDYLDSKQRAREAEMAADYAAAERALSGGNTAEAIRLFRLIGSYRDASARADALERGRDDEDRAQRYESAKQSLDWGDYQTANNGFAALGDYLDSKQYADYSDAMIRRAREDYAGAEQSFIACGDFLDAAERAKECKYMQATAAYRNGDYQTAITLFGELGEYSDSATQLDAATNEYNAERYAQALFAYYANEKEKAIEIFESLGDYSDSATWVARIRAEQ